MQAKILIDHLPLLLYDYLGGVPMIITRLTVQAGHHDRQYCPVEATLSVPQEITTRCFFFDNIVGRANQEIPAQQRAASTERFLCVT